MCVYIYIYIYIYTRMLVAHYVYEAGDVGEEHGSPESTCAPQISPKEREREIT